MAVAQRKKLEIPSEMMDGPVTLTNYNYRVLAYVRSKDLERGEAHPTMRVGDPQWKAWLEYYDSHLGGRPWFVWKMIAGEIAEAVLPEKWPQWFDPNYTPKKVETEK